MFAGKERLPALPLHPIKAEQPFDRWGVDFIGPINPPSSTGHRFGVPDSIVSDNALPFVGLRVTDWAIKHNIYLNTSSNYYPQGNGLVESTNKNLIRIIKWTLQENQRDWHSKLKAALWVDIITPKQIIGNSPYRLVYGKEARLSIEIELPALDMATQMVLFEEEDPMQVRYA
ncbi:uncharacterized protein LOC131078293 [Cryptomeria japonica]|uniref:uncharacterized protein LOC131078293 n=1 Tax=Cryptomeria japonica TaxID=3369 RepID=UPI0027DA6DF2|nr:uncharacterized protein LOC131078293 [Cryptomeria japonica]